MSNDQGCTFCRRYGLPVLPVRPAVMEKGDRTPVLPGSITVPVVAEGGADYIWDWLEYGEGLTYSVIEFLDGRSDISGGKAGIGLGHLINSVGVGMMTIGAGSRITISLISLLGVSDVTLAGSVAAFFLGPAGIFVGMLLVLGAGAWLLSHTRNDIQNWLLSTQWRRVPPGESDIPAIYPDARMEKDDYMALNTQGAAHV